MIFSFLTPNAINNLAVQALITLENLFIFLSCLYFEIFSFDYNQTTLRLIIFLSVLISVQILAFIFDILSKNIVYRRKIRYLCE